MKDAEVFGKDSTETLRNIRVGSSGNPLIAGDVASGVADSGNPIKSGGIGRTTNPSAVADGQRVGASFDKLGRQLVIPHQVRDLISTAYVQQASGAEATLLAGVAGVFLDLVEVTCANESAAAWQVDLRSETGGGIMKTFSVPANSTVTRDFIVPIPQNVAAGAWTATIISQGALTDISNPTVSISALFIRNT